MSSILLHELAFLTECKFSRDAPVNDDRANTPRTEDIMDKFGAPKPRANLIDLIVAVSALASIFAVTMAAIPRGAQLADELLTLQTVRFEGSSFP